MTRILVFCVIFLALAGCELDLPEDAPSLPKREVLCGPLRGLVGGVIGSSAEDMRRACAIAEAINGR